MADIPRRAILRGTALGAVAASGALASSQAARAAIAGTAQPPATMIIVADRAALAALPNPLPGQIVYLAEGARAGLFACMAGRPTERDLLQGLTVSSTVADMHFARQWDGTHGRPEWFGAIAGDEDVDCAAAIEACYALCPVTQLGQADYFIRRTLVFGRSGRTVRGAGNWGRGEGEGTRIILHAGARGAHVDDIMVVGSRDKPAVDSESYPTENHFSNFTLLRQAACTPHGSGEHAHYPAGLRVAHLFHCTFRQITSLESSIGFYIGGVVYTTFDDCYVIRKRAGTSAAGDYAVGYFLDGHVSFGYPGGNASLYMNRCSVADQHPAHVDPTGLLGRGAFVDTFLDNFESARISTGMAFRVEGKRAFGNTIDLHIRNAILDGCAKYGLDIDLDGTASASVEIIDPYVTPSGTGDRGISIRDGAGLTTITGGQVHGDFANGSLFISRTRGVRVQGTKVHQATRPVVAQEARGLMLEPQISNYQKSSPNFAVACRGITRSIVRPTLTGDPVPAFRGGVSLDAASSFIEVDGSAIDPACLGETQAQWKVQFDGADARSSAAFTRAGNRLVGVLD